jgi:hypothetical protein
VSEETITVRERIDRLDAMAMSLGTARERDEAARATIKAFNDVATEVCQRGPGAETSWANDFARGAEGAVRAIAEACASAGEHRMAGRMFYLLGTTLIVTGLGHENASQLGLALRHAISGGDKATAESAGVAGVIVAGMVEAAAGLGPAAKA